MMEGSKLMKVFQRLKFKMKVSYSCWKNKMMLKEFALTTIKSSIIEKHQVASKQLMKFLVNMKEETRSTLDEQAIELIPFSIDLRQSAAEILAELSYGDFKKEANLVMILARTRMTAPLQTKFRQLTHAYWEASNDLSRIVKKLIKSEVKKSLNYVTDFVLSVYFDKV